MADDAIYLGIDLTSDSIRVAASNGQRTAINGVRTDDWDARLELALYGLSLNPERRIYACVAVQSLFPLDEARELGLAAARNIAFEDVRVSPLPLATARAAGRNSRAVSIALDAAGTSVALVRGGVVEEPDQDFIRPIPGREAREIAVSVRCLLKRHDRAAWRDLLACTVVSGDPSEIERIRRASIERELEGLGAKVDFLLDPFAASIGACHLARDGRRGWDVADPATRLSA